jgi:hypothetical protein
MRSASIARKSKNTWSITGGQKNETVISRFKKEMYMRTKVIKRKRVVRMDNSNSSATPISGKRYLFVLAYLKIRHGARGNSPLSFPRSQ